MIFGTAWMPKPNEWPEVGVPEYGEIASVGELLARPLMRAKVVEEVAPFRRYAGD
jgi:hypothetical protein